jgi:molybdopterin converting factor small subunit
MSIEVYIPPSLQSQIDNVKLVKVEGKTVGECLADLICRYPQLDSGLLKGRKIHKGLSLFVNGENAHPQGLNKPVHDGDKLYIMNILVGG